MGFLEFAMRWFVWAGVSGLLLYGSLRWCAGCAGLRGAELLSAAGIMVLACLVAVETAWGAAGNLHFSPIAASLLLVALLLIVKSRPDPPGAEAAGSPLGQFLDPPGRGPFGLLWLFLFTAAAAHLIVRLVIALIQPPSNWDGVWYHLPTAVEWFKGKSLFLESRPIYWYFPHNAELVLAWWLMPFQSDLLANLYNFPILIWLGFGIWSLAERLRISEESRWLLVLSLPHLGTVDSIMLGTQKNDLLLAALFISGLAILFGLASSGIDRKARVLLSALAGGLLVGTKLNGIGYSLVLFLLTLGIASLSLRSRALAVRSAACYFWGMALGAFWFIHNWVSTGRPLWVTDPFDPAAVPSSVIQASLLCTTRSLKELQPFIRDLIEGAGWFPLFGIAGSFLLLFRSPIGAEGPARSFTRWISLLTFVCLLLFLGTPLTNLVRVGHSVVRLGFPFVILSMLTFFSFLDHFLSRWPTRVRILVQIGLAPFVLAPSGNVRELFHRLCISPRGLAGIVLFLLGLAVLAAWRRYRPLLVKGILCAAALSAVSSPVVLWRLQEFRSHSWSAAYARIWSLDQERSGIFRWIEATDGLKIAVYGSQIYYPFYGPRWQNRLHFAQPSEGNNPSDWARCLSKEGVQLVVFYKFKGPGPLQVQKAIWPIEREWLMAGNSLIKFRLLYRDNLAEAWGFPKSSPAGG